MMIKLQATMYKYSIMLMNYVNVNIVNDENYSDNYEKHEEIHANLFRWPS